MQLPEGWEYKKLEHVAFLQRGFDLPSNNRIPGKIPVISSSGVSGYHNSAQCQFPGVVMGRYGTIGNVFFIEQDYWPLNTSLWVKSFCGNYPKYVYYLLSKIDYTKFSDKTGVPGVNRNDLHAIKIPVPPLPEQQKIAQILATWDKAIEKLAALIAAKQKRKKALMQQLLTGKMRFAGFYGEWKEVEIGKFISESKIPSASNNPAKRLTVRLNFNGIEHREFRGTESLEATAHFVRKAGQFIYGKQNFHKGAFGIIPEKFDLFETSQDIPSFDFLKNCNAKWFFYYCSQDWFYTGIEDFMTGTGSKRLNPKVFQKIKIPFPLIEEQQKIAAVLSAADREIETQQKHLAALKQQKQGLMQQLLTGKKRVKTEV